LQNLISIRVCIFRRRDIFNYVIELRAQRVFRAPEVHPPLVSVCIFCGTLVRDMTLTNVAAACKWHHAVRQVSRSPDLDPIPITIPNPSRTPSPCHIGGYHATRFPVIIHYPNARSMCPGPPSLQQVCVCVYTARLDYAFNLRTLLDFSWPSQRHLLMMRPEFVFWILAHLDAVAQPQNYLRNRFNWPIKGGNRSMWAKL